MSNDKYRFYVKSEEVESTKHTIVIQYLKLTMPYLVIVGIMLLLLTRDGTSNSTKLGGVGDVGGSITIYNSDGKQLPKGHIHISKHNKEQEAIFLESLEYLTENEGKLRDMLISLNDRLVLITELNGECDRHMVTDLEPNHITLWLGACGKGYHKLNGEKITHADIADSLDTVRYPDLTKLFENDIIPCIYIGN